MKEQRYIGSEDGSEDNMVKDRQTAAAAIGSLIANLASDDGITRVKARHALILYRDKAVKPLIEALADRNQWVRWEAAKALGKIGSSAATHALVKALEDRMFDVRWLAAQGLITIGPEAIIPVLNALIKRADSVWMREGAHHVLHDLARGRLREVLWPIVAALEDVDSPIEVPFAAKAALNVLKHTDINQEGYVHINQS
jgi:HEAT repeat protein